VIAFDLHEQGMTAYFTQALEKIIAMQEDENYDD
jgi:hypothetical protein